MKSNVSSTKVIQLLADQGSASTEQLLSLLQNQYAILASPAEIAPTLAKLEREGFIVCADGQWQLKVEEK